MSRSGLLCVVALLSLAACGESPTSPPALRTGAPSLDQASSGASVASVPFETTIDIGCASESVDVTGFLLAVYQVAVTGQNATVYWHYSPQNVSGVGSASGDMYRATGVTQQAETVSFINGLAVFTFVNNFDIIGQGTGNDFLVHEVAHVTVNANGATTVEFDKASVDCK